MANIHILALDATRMGGAGVYTAGLIAVLAARGHAITLICHEASDQVKRVAQVLEIPRFNSQQGLGMWRFGSWNQIGHYRRMLLSLHLPDADIVIASAQPIAVPYHSLFPRTPMIYLPHSLVAPVELRSYGYTDRIQRFVAVSTYHYLEKKCLAISRTTIRFTHAASTSFKDFYGDDLCSKFQILPMPINSRPQRKREKITGAMRLLSVGRLIKTKNLSFLINALYSLRTFDWHLEIVGSGGETAELKAEVTRLQLDKRISFTGHLDNVMPSYERADIFLFPSILENSPVVLLEAMSHSLPSLSFKPDGKYYLGANDEIVIHGETGLLAKDDEDFKRILRDILTKHIDLHVMGNTAWETISARHSWISHGIEIEKLMQQQCDAS